MIYINRWNYIQEVRTASDFNTKVNTEIRLIIFFAAKDGEALYSHQKKKKTGSWLWLISWTAYCQIQTEVEEGGENH